MIRPDRCLLPRWTKSFIPTRRTSPWFKWSFTNKEDMTRFMEDLKEADWASPSWHRGCSRKSFSVVGRRFEPSLRTHLLGVHGRVEKLPPRRPWISPPCAVMHWYRRTCDENSWPISSRQRDWLSAAETLAKDCICGILNPVRPPRFWRRCRDSSGLRNAFLHAAA